VASPDFLYAALTEGNDVRAFFTESRMQFDGTSKLHRKSGFGLHQLRNRYRLPYTTIVTIAKVEAFGSDALTHYSMTELIRGG
jgi:hypothetical protein